MPIIAATVHLLFILSAADRVGINPTPTEDACNALTVSALLYVVCVINYPLPP